ncbi:phosphate acyltransferase [Mycoplasmopsis cynos]|uniref:phosphate acyltransferase n=1 Tax=Mycoplasmopsis cynos TaxID=171284 RepID=UPI0029622BB9
MNFKKEIEAKVQSLNRDCKSKKTILLIDGEDERSIEAAKLLVKNGLVNVILLVKRKEWFTLRWNSTRSNFIRKTRSICHTIFWTKKR